MKHLSLVLSSAVVLAANTFNGQVGLSLELVEQHTGMVGVVDLAGYNTYRLYLTIEDLNDVPTIIFGKEGFPLEVNTTTTFFQSEFAGSTASNLNLLFATAIPSIVYDSFVTMTNEDMNDEYSIFALNSPDQFWEESFENGSNLIINDVVGGGWFGAPAAQGPPEAPGGKIFIAQLTTDGNLWGSINVDYIDDMPDDGTFVAPTTAYGLQFGSPDEMIIGCTDPVALNYLPEANVAGDCEYEPGDLNGDGNTDTSDLLILISEFGCLEDCDFGDLNGDGMVNTLDLLIFLGLL